MANLVFRIGTGFPQGRPPGGKGFERVVHGLYFFPEGPEALKTLIPKRPQFDLWITDRSIPPDGLK